MLSTAKNMSNATDWNDSASVVEVNCWRVVPACMAMKESVTLIVEFEVTHRGRFYPLFSFGDKLKYIKMV